MTAGDDLEALTQRIFEVLTANQFESGRVRVERNVLLEGADGPRQVDVVVRSKVGPIDLTTIVECKDYGRRVNVTAIDALHSVALDVKANRAVMVTRGGFSKTAMQKAARLGIALYTADRVGNAGVEVFQIPIHVCEVRPTDVHVQCRVNLEGGDQVGTSELLSINGIDLLVRLRDHLVESDPAMSLRPGIHAWKPTGLGDPLRLCTAAGEIRSIEQLELKYRVVERHFFGYLGDVEEALVLRDQLHQKDHLLLPAETITIDYAAYFAEFNSAADLPVQPVLVANVAVVPDADADVSFHGLQAKRIGPTPP